MPTVTLIGKKKHPATMSRTMPMGGKTYTFQKDVKKEGIPEAVAARCLRVNEREGYLVFRVEDMPAIVDQQEPGQTVAGEIALQAEVEIEQPKVRNQKPLATKAKTKVVKKKKVVQGSL